ncbi:MAG TPA: ABC transporter ATP-binding protein [Candidatus Saccharimonadales bacterium]|nr:ABC transporter ATP-binding protein [Candidatus Saccharimonadales bacterium]
MLSAQNIDKSYKNGQKAVRALKDADITVQNGEFVCVIGPNGCGKSTLLKITAGILKPTAGKLEAADNVAYLPQQPSLLPWRTIEENLLLAAEIQGKPVKTAAVPARKLLKEFGLARFGKFYPHMLSGGMQQKVSLLRTILFEPELMLLDEPFSSLDAITRSELQDWLLDLWQKTRPGVVCVTHDIREAVFLADTIYVMNGRPGSIKKKIKVNLPRPRRRSQLHLPQAAKLEKQLNRLLVR